MINLDKYLQNHGIPPNDTVGRNLFVAGILGIGEIKRRKGAVNLILANDNTQFSPKLIADSSKIDQEIVIEEFLEAYKNNVLVKLLVFLTRNNFLKPENKEYIMDMLLNRTERIRLDVLLDITDSDLGDTINDPYGSVRSDFRKRNIELDINYTAIIGAKAIRQINAGTMESITAEELCVMTFAHELMHVASIEFPSSAPLQEKAVEFEVRSSIYQIPEEQFFNQRYYQYRCGYDYVFLDNSSLDFTPINEAITEIMAAEFYNSLIGLPGFENLKHPYKIIYSGYVDRFYQALDALSRGDEKKREEMMNRIRQGYFHGGEAGYTALLEIISPMLPYFEDIDDQKPEIII